MKSRILSVILCLAVMLASSTYAQQDPNDLGEPDTLIFDFVLMPDVTTNEMHAQLDLYAFNDAQDVASVGAGFEWSNANMQMDSAVVSPEALAAFNFLQYTYYKDNIDSTNARLLFQAGLSRISGSGMVASGSRKLLVSYYFTLSSWANTDSIAVDSNTFSGGTFLSFTPTTGSIYQPYFPTPEVYYDSTYSGPSNLLVSEDSLFFTYTLGEPAPGSQQVEITSDNEPLSFTLVETASWLQKTPSSGTTPRTVTVSVSTVGLTPGVYFDSILVDAPDASNPPQYIYAELTVAEPPPTISVDPESFVFNAIADGANPAPQTLTITNTGSSTLDWTVSNSETWLSLAPLSGTDMGSVVLSVDIFGLTFGDYYDTVWVSDPDATNNPVGVPVRLSIVSSLPVIDVDTVYNWVVAYAELDTFAREFEVRNGGGGSLNFWVEEKPGSVAELPAIIDLDPDTSVAPDFVTVTYVGQIPDKALTVTDTVIVWSDDAVNSPQYIELNVRVVENPAVIDVSSDPLAIDVYECSQGYGQELPSVSFTIGNAGGDDPMAFVIDYDAEYWSLDTTTGTAPTTVTLTALTDDLAVGTYVDTLMVTSIWALNNPYPVEVLYNVIEGTEIPEIVVPRTEYYYLWRIDGDPIADSGFDVFNLNGGCMEWGVQEEIEWLTPGTSTGNVPGHVDLTIDPAITTVGPYAGTVQVVAPGASNSPHDLDVDLDVWQLYGDWDWNGVITMQDLTYMISHLYILPGEYPPEPFYEIGNLDASPDGLISMSDLTILIDHLYITLEPIRDNPF